MIKSIGISTLAVATLLAAAAPASAISAGPRNEARFGDTPDRAQVRTHEQIRRQQVRQTQSVPLYQPLFAPLYQGKDSPWQRTKRAFD